MNGSSPPLESPATNQRGGETSTEGETNNPASLPTVSFPKGGGALRGVDEKLQINPATGTGSLAVPIAASPGRGGFGPTLALSYDSGAGNGSCGLGWNIGLPSIRRKTQRGLPQYLDSDTFVLAGAEDLVPALVEVGGAWIPDIVDDVEYTTREDQRYDVCRYRPRIEGLFARIERWVRRSDNDTHWRVITKDNRTTIYGEAAAARIADPADSRRVFEWLIERSYDDKGNIIAYEYKPEDGVGVDVRLPQERNRRGALAQRYLKRVRYGNTLPYLAHLNNEGASGFNETAWLAENDWCFELCLDYGDHDVTAPTLAEAPPWPVRPDPFSSYRAGFEIRTYRLCRRILMFHRFAELGIVPVLVKSTRLTYDNDNLGNPIATQLVAVDHIGYKPGEEPAATPPMRFRYSEARIDENIRTLPTRAGQDLGHGAWIDLDGEGLSGLLTRRPGAWHYQRNLGGGQFSVPERVRTLPSLAMAGGGTLRDPGGDGTLDLVTLSPGLGGRFERTHDADWEPFRPFLHVPNLDWSDPNQRFIDVTGDGHADVLITEDDCFCWHRSEGKDGFAARSRVAKALDEEHGPTVVFGDPTQTIFLADMSGDGLTDIARIRNGQVCYWPNTGYGTFGAKVTMNGAPVFDTPDAFDPERIRLGDIDGTGTTDILYVGADSLRLWPNQSGNSLGEARVLSQFPRVDNVAQVQLIDLLGTGTACVVWQSPLPGETRTELRYVALMSEGKPYLLSEVDNGMGAVSRLRYAPSTKFYLADRLAGRPWVTKLPFPVHVVERRESYDAIARNRFVSLYAYHHGYYDGEEREFRGFGMVEQWDGEQYSERGDAGLFPLGENDLGEASHIPPVHTKTWFHTGAFLERQRISRHFESEYYDGDPEAWTLPDTELPLDLTASEQREACRALKGRMLRQEVYALDDDVDKEAHPYSVAEAKAHLRLEQPQARQAHAVFYACNCETIAYHYERNPADPRIAHSHTLAIDRYGNPTKTAAIAYPRRGSGHLPEQMRMHVTVSESDLLHLDQTPWTYRVGLPFEGRAYEVTGISDVFPWKKAALADAIASRRLLSRSRAQYYRDALDGPLAFEDVESLAIPYAQYKLAFTQEILDQPEIGGRITPALLSEAGYRNDIDSDPTHWWIPSGQVVFDPVIAPQHFYLPARSRDPFGAESYVTYDNYDLLIESATDAVGYTTSVQNDYRVLAPWEQTDPNGNRAQVAFDTRGAVIATAEIGKDGEGDTLADPTTRLEYDLFAYDRTRDSATPQPVFVRTFARERHADPTTPWHESIAYSDGFGRVIQNKVPAEDDPSAPGVDRWVGNGATVFNNKGLPVHQYEPFFDSHPDYTDDDALVRLGVTPTIHYDPLGRVVRTDLPDGTFSKVEFDPWKQSSYDQNDTVLDSDWYDARFGEATPAGEAAGKAAAHANTPSVAHLDVLGRAFVTLAHNIKGGINEYIPTRTELDIEGNPLAISDGRRCEGLSPEAATQHVGNVVMTYAYAMGGMQLYQRSMDAGERWALVDVMGKPCRGWDSRGHVMRTDYDALRRPTHVWVDDGARSILAERLVYADSLDEAEARAQNLLGQLVLHFDGAGLAKNHAFDFKGNPVAASRRLAVAYRETPDWTALDGLSPAAMEATSLVDSEVFSTAASHDALNRVVEGTAPDGSVHAPGYNKAGLLETVHVRHRGAASGTVFVENIDYNARGQRVAIRYANGVTTTYEYDPKTFRLLHLLSARASGRVIQDLHYTYDAVGNITELRDNAIEPVYFSNEAVHARSRYTYDPLYRLIEASGRESAASNGIPTNSQIPRLTAIPAHDGALRNYTERYSYDPVGNILALQHRAGPEGTWTRTYDYAPANNRLTSHDLPGSATASYSYDVHGSMQAMPHLPAMDWDYKDQLQHAVRNADNETFFTYDSQRQRVRKVWLHGGTRDERIYLGGYEIQRRYAAAGTEPQEELQTLHVIDDAERICMVETPTIKDDLPIASPTPRFRYQLTNHLGSATVELDETTAANVITYEEYHPYGTTAYHAQNGTTLRVSAKRYRYTGMERDEETGLAYHTARYYAPWLTRWTSSDPIGIEGGLNLYRYASSQPMGKSDRKGTQDEHTDGPLDQFMRWIRGHRGVSEVGATAGRAVADDVAEHADPDQRVDLEDDVSGNRINANEQEAQNDGTRERRRDRSRGRQEPPEPESPPEAREPRRRTQTHPRRPTPRPRTREHRPSSTRGSGDRTRHRSRGSASIGVLGVVLAAVGIASLILSVQLAQTQEDRARILNQTAGDAAVGAIAARLLGAGPAMGLFLTSDQGGLSNEAMADRFAFEAAWQDHVEQVSQEIAADLLLVDAAMEDLLRINRRLQSLARHPSPLTRPGYQAGLEENQLLLIGGLARTGERIRSNLEDLGVDDINTVVARANDEGVSPELVDSVFNRR